jgi:hypothetical protein
MSESTSDELPRHKEGAQERAASSKEKWNKDSNAKWDRPHAGSAIGQVNGRRPRHCIEAAAVAAGPSEIAISQILPLLSFRIQPDGKFTNSQQ